MTTPPLVRHRRATEASLILIVAGITTIAWILAALATDTELPNRIIPFGLGLLALLGIAHLAIRRLAPAADPTLLPLAAYLHGIGYVMIARLDDHLAGLQTTWSLLAVAGMIITLVIVPRITVFVRYQWWLLALALGLLVLPFVPGVGVTFGGARIWVSIGPINFQPGEFAKVLLAVFFAAYLADRRQLLTDRSWRLGPLRLPQPRDAIPLIAGWALAVVIMVGQRDLGSSLLFFTLFVVMVWIATERISYLIAGVLLFAGAAYISWRLFGHVQTRVSIWLDPWADRYGRG